MRFDVITLFPELFAPFLQHGINRRAFESGLVDVHLWNPREFAEGNYRRVDDRPFGGGPGMVMMAEPLWQCLQAVRAERAEPEGSRAPVVLFSPIGVALNHTSVECWSASQGAVLLCGRYEGIDQRFIDHHVDEELSIGDYVLSGGELGALVVIDAVTRLLPGVLNKIESAEQDSFENGLLDCPHYTRPEKAPEGDVPEVLKSGNHAEIARWRRMQSLGQTWLKRPDLLAKLALSKADAKLLAEFRSNINTSQSCPQKS